MSSKVKKRRVFLCSVGEADSYISWSVGTEVFKPRNSKKLKGWVTADIKIADCNRTVHLGFDCASVKERARKLKKLDRLLVELSTFRRELIDQIDNMEEKISEHN